MTMGYSFSILRYTYDPVTQEFVNVGVVAYCQESKQLRAKCTQHYGRISKLFVCFDGVRLRQTLRFIQDQLNDLNSGMANRLEFPPAKTLHEILTSVIPFDDSSLQFAKGGVGLTEDLDIITESLFSRYVERYTVGQDASSRGDDDVWRSFRASLDRRSITSHLIPKRVVAKNYDYEFDHAWKNGIWQALEPISFDLKDAQTIIEKASRWLGRASGLEDSPEKFKLSVLLGAPSDERFREAYTKAENLLHKMPIEHELIRESDAEDFARDLAIKIRETTLVK